MIQTLRKCEVVKAEVTSSFFAWRLCFGSRSAGPCLIIAPCFLCLCDFEYWLFVKFSSLEPHRWLKIRAKRKVSGCCSRFDVGSRILWCYFSSWCHVGESLFYFEVLHELLWSNCIYLFNKQGLGTDEQVLIEILCSRSYEVSVAIPIVLKWVSLLRKHEFQTKAYWQINSAT